MKTKILYIDGMHCSSCELIIKNELEKIPNICSADVSQKKNSVTIQYKNKINIPEINKALRNNNYRLSENKPGTERKSSGTAISFLISALLITAFFLLDKSEITNIAQASPASPLTAFLFLGLVAGISSCAALVGGLVLSLSKKWDEDYSDEKKYFRRIRPQILFNSGRLFSYALLGGMLGSIGEKFTLSPAFSSILVFIVSAAMLIIGFQMIGIKQLKKIRIALPKSATDKIFGAPQNKKNRSPFLIGALTFFLPCGFTITAQGFALLSGSFISGGLIMLMFAIGTLPSLLLIGLTSVKFISSHNTALIFSKTAGILIVFFALFNINSQLNALGFTSASDLAKNQKEEPGLSQKSGKSALRDIDGLPLIENGKQIVKTTATSSGYSPNYIKVRKNIPVEWRIEDRGTSGCTNAIISRNLFNGQINLTPGETSIKEFLPTQAGKFKFSCWMGMVSGTIEVVE